MIQSRAGSRSKNVRLAADTRTLLGSKHLYAAGLALSLGLASPVILAQQPVVQDLSASSTGSFYQQADTQVASNGALVLFNQVQEHQREIQELRGQVEELRHQLEQLRNQSEQRYLDMDDRLFALESGSATSNTANSSGSVPESTADSTAQAADAQESEPESPKVSNNASPEVQKAYQDAFAFVQNRQFNEAVSAFNAFVDEYPGTPLTPNGYYWLGELHAANDDLADAEMSFNKVINDFGDSNKVADALYKLGLVKARQGDAERSRELLTRVQEEFPQSSAAGLAGDFLRQSSD
ncbi:tol-pal system protein YbgF [Vreelandella aquamarina]